MLFIVLLSDIHHSASLENLVGERGYTFYEQASSLVENNIFDHKQRCTALLPKNLRDSEGGSNKSGRIHEFLHP